MRSETYRRPLSAPPDDSTADILAGLDAGFASDPAGPRVAVVLGHGAKLRVRDGHLIAEDGEGWYRRTRSWNRATGRLRRLVVGANSGFVSLDVFRWCRDAKVAVVVIDDDAELLLTPGDYGTDDARLRRLQAAPPAELARDIATELLTAKLAGQALLLRDALDRDALSDTVHGVIDAMHAAEDIDELRQLEASAAACYFDAWYSHPATTLRFTTRDSARVPAHWLVYEGRRSVLTNGASARSADRPLNSLLNLTYRFAEIECRLALITMGLDPGMGFIHTDMPNRDSLALDVLEPLRPNVERLTLQLVAERTFTRADFVERTDGSVRIAPALVQQLAGTMPRWARLAAPHAERLAHALGRAVVGAYKPRTPLSGRNQRVAQAVVKARKETARALHARGGSTADRDGVLEQTSLDVSTCIDCGGPVARPRDLRCERCLDQAPGQARETRRRRGRAIAAARAELEAWKREHPDANTPRELYLETILPRLAGIKLRDIMAATGLTKSTASMIRSGRHVPAQRHWPALAGIAGVAWTSATESGC
jgi:CRISPR-associated protein Cas1